MKSLTVLSTLAVMMLGTTARADDVTFDPSQGSVEASSPSSAPSVP